MRPLSIREAPPSAGWCGGSFHRLCVLIEHVQSIGGIHTTRDVVRRRTSRNAEIERDMLDFCVLLYVSYVPAHPTSYAV